MLTAKGLEQSLRRLDARLSAFARAAADAPPIYDGKRGSYLTARQIQTLAGLAASYAGYDVNETSGRLQQLRTKYRLTQHEIDTVLIALAPELSPAYEAIFAFLQNDASRPRPSVDLILRLLCSSTKEKFEFRANFHANAPLLRHSILRTYPGSDALLNKSVEVEPVFLAYLLGNDALDARIASFARIVFPTGNQTKEEACDTLGLAQLLRRASRKRRPLTIYLVGPPGAGKRQLAEALASELGAPLLAADLSQVPDDLDEFAEALRVFMRESALRDSIRYLSGLDALRDRPHYSALLGTLHRAKGVILLAGSSPWSPHADAPQGVLSVRLESGGWDERREEWRRAIGACKAPQPGAVLDFLASSFKLARAQVRDAVATAANQALWESRDVTRNDLFAAARAQAGHELSTLARKVDPAYTWDHIVLPPDAVTQLRELCRRVSCRHRVLADWGFDRRLSGGKGANALFSGGSGTGKTMAAEVVASELELNLYKIDLAGVVSKYIGETEKNLDRIFQAAARSSAILFFDEADALFGKRSEVRDSHDRYANLEISYLLQKMEEYDGIAILATNLRQNMDEAFVRRLAFSITFPFPDIESRRLIWQGVWPKETPLHSNIDFTYLATHFKLTGGNIRNIALAAAFEAAASGGPVGMDHLLHATQREHQKLGKPLADDELFGLLPGRVA